MPQAIRASGSSREGTKRRGYEAALSPRSSPPIGPPMAARERLPSIRSLLPDIPPPSERAFSQNRAPVRENPTGPRCAIPARLSPPPASRRTHIHPNGETSNRAPRSPRQKEERSPIRSQYDGPSNYQLPIHSGPPTSRTSYTSSTLGPPPASPYAPNQTDTRRGYTNNDSHSIPPPPVPYHQAPHGHTPPPPYPPSRDYRNDSPDYGPTYYGDHRHRDHRNGDHRNGGSSSHQAPHALYQQTQYGYPPPPPSSTNGNYAIHHRYQNGYHHGSVQFETDEPGGQAPRRRRGNLPRDTTDMLKQWFQDHLGHPYPTEDEKQYLCRQTGLQMTQISNWFINARRRRIPELVNQATAETLLRESSGESNGSNDS